MNLERFLKIVVFPRKYGAKILRISTIYLDLDDVLVNFDGAVCQLWGLDYGRVMAKRAGQWCMLEALGVTRDEFVETIDAQGSDWWASLPLLPWAPYLIDICCQHARDVVVLTCPSTFQHSREGKRSWLTANTTLDYRIVSDKERFAGTGTLLVDDRLDNVGKFIMGGGEGILFPSNGNCLHKYRGNITYFKHILEERVNGIQIQQRQ